MKGVPNKGNARSFHSICVQDGMVIPKVNAGASAPVSLTPSFELAASRMKRGGVEEIVVS